MRKIVIIGIGNILLSDEGVGVRAIEELRRRYAFPLGVYLFDGGTLGLDLVQFMSGCEKLIVIDAVAGGQQPGSLYIFPGERIGEYFQKRISLHEAGIQEVLHILEILEKAPQEIVIIGLEPGSLEWGTDLSSAVADNLHEAVDAVIGQLEVWGITASLRQCL